MSGKPDYAANVREAAKPTRIDKALLQIAPAWAMGRIKARVDGQLRLMLANRAAENFAAYEAADNDRLRGEKWIASKLTQNDAIGTELETMIDRAADLYRNDVFAASAVNGRVDNVIGQGIRPQARVQAARGVITQTQAEAFNTQIELLWHRWAITEGFYAKQRLLERCNGIYGESWLYMGNDDNPEKPVTLSVQVIHPQRIPVYSWLQQGRPERRLGLRIDNRGNAVAAFVRRSLPNDSYAADQMEDEVSLTDLLHCFEETSPGQLRGVPWLAPAMGKLKDLKDFVHAHLVAEQVAACYGAFVTGATDPALLAEAGRSRSNLEDLSPGTIQYLGDGESVQFSDPARPGTTLGPYVEWALHGVAAALRYPYELLAKQFTNNFSGGRLALIDGRITFKCWQHVLIDRTLRKLWARFVDQCVIQGAVAVDPMRYEENRAHFLNHQWIPPGWPWVDPEKEVRADVAAIEAGLTTQTESLASRGRDFDETMQQIEREMYVKADMEARVAAYRASLALDEDTNPADDNPDDTPDNNADDSMGINDQFAIPKKYAGISFTPPAGVRAEARQGLEWRREHKRGGTAVGIARARDLANGKQVSPSTINRMVSFFARHEVDKQGEGFSPGEAGYPSNGRIAWALWGGDPGKAWAGKVQRQMQARDKANASN
jgi:lambda family phage portal protein